MPANLRRRSHTAAETLSTRQVYSIHKQGPGWDACFADGHQKWFASALLASSRLLWCRFQALSLRAVTGSTPYGTRLSTG